MPDAATGGLVRPIIRAGRELGSFDPSESIGYHRFDDPRETAMTRQLALFGDFDPYCLEERNHPVSPRLHFTGATLLLVLLTWSDWVMWKDMLVGRIPF